ncbi:MAG: hypothetical protein KKD74_04485 [Bacteroidetes bacterium]|nr:hypothetical protein [Bacteroidota bacterium]
MNQQKYTGAMLHKLIAPASLAFAFLLSGLLQPLSAQTHNERVTIVGSFQPQLDDFYKINVEPGTEQAVFQHQEVKFTFLDKIQQTQTSLETIPPLAVVPNRSSEMFNNYFRFAFGSSLSPVVAFQHQSALSDKTRFGLGLRHFSSWSTITDYAPSDFMKNGLSLGIAHSLQDHTLEAGLTYQHDAMRYYGFKPADYGVSINKEDIAQRYQTIGFETNLKSNYQEISKLHHRVGLKYTFFNNKFQTSENELNLDAALRKDFELFSNAGSQALSLGTKLDFYGNKDSLNTASNGRFSLVPAFSLKGEFYRLRIGLRADMLFGDSSSTVLAPDISAGLYMLENALEVYVSVTGGAERNSFRQLAGENPFIAPIIPLGWEKTSLRFKAGAKAGFIKNLDLNAAVSYAKTNLPFFVTDSTAIYANRFTLVYDKTSVFSFTADAAYRLNEIMAFGGQLKLTQYKPENLTKAWHKPGFEFLGTIEVSPIDKLHISGSVQLTGTRYAPTYLAGVETVHELDPLVDMNAGAAYNISDQLSVFAELNNLFGANYQRFYHYPVQGLQLFGGLSYKF